MTLDELPFTTGDTPPTQNGARGRRCGRHVWARYPVLPDYTGVAIGTAMRCIRCGKWQDEARARRGRNNRARGNAIEREVGHRLGLRRVGQYGGPDDLRDPLFAAQVKSGGSFSERYWSWLKAVPVDAGQTAILVVTDAPGPGHKRRAVVVLDIEDWRALHGRDAQ